MVDKSKKVPLGELSAYERWELPNIGDPSQVKKQSEVRRQEKLKLPTAEQIESITKQAYESGFEEGHGDGFSKGFEAGKLEGLESGKKEGHQQGLLTARSEVDAEIAQLKALMSQLINPIEQQQQQVEEAMLNVAVALSRAVIHRELSVDSSSMLSTLSRVFEELPAFDGGAVLRIHASDQANVDSAMSDLKSSVEVVCDASVQKGGFILKTSSQLIDYTVEKRFQKAIQGMLDSAVNQKESGIQEVPSTIDSLSDYSAETLNEEVVVDDSSSVNDSSVVEDSLMVEDSSEKSMKDVEAVHQEIKTEDIEKMNSAAEADAENEVPHMEDSISLDNQQDEKGTNSEHE